jgi:hypothetical protein
VRILSTSGVLTASTLFARLSLRRGDFNDQLGTASHLRCASRWSFENPRTTIQLVHTGSSIGRIAYLRGVAYFLCTLVHGPSWDDARGIREQDGWRTTAGTTAAIPPSGPRSPTRPSRKPTVKQLQLRSTRDAEYLFLRRLPHCYRPPHSMPNPAAGLDSSGFSCFLGKRDLLAAFKEEPHKRQEQHKF